MGAASAPAPAPVTPRTAAAGAAVAGAAAVAVQLGGPVAALALAGLAGFALLVTVFVRAPHVAGALLVVLLVAQPALREFVSPQFAPLEDVLVAAALTAAAWHRLSGRAQPVDAWLAGGVLLLIALYLINPVGRHDSAWFYGARLVIEALLLFLAAQALPDPERTWRWTVRALVGACVVAAGYGLVQQAVGFERLVNDFGYTYGVQVRETAAGQLRSFGTLDEPFSYALILLAGLAALLVAVRTTPWSVLLMVLLLAGLTASFVRSAALGVAGVLVVALLRSGRRVVAVALATALVLGSITVLASVPQTRPTAADGTAEFFLTLNGRTKAWSVLLPTPEAWAAGLGVGSVGTGASRAAADVGEAGDGAAPVITDAEFQRRNVDSSYLATVADVGVIGLGLLLAVIARAWWLASGPARRGSRPAWLVLAAGAAVLIDALTRTSLTSVPAGFVVLWVIGVSLAAAQAERRRAAAAPASPPVHHAPISASRR